MGSTSTVYTYIYDGKGNITYVVCGSDTIKYTYDDIGQLIRENNSLLGKTYVYEYDDAGNILFKNTYAYTNEFTITSSPTATYTYTYGNSEWGDQLTGYNGSAITYDAVGNPLSYYGGFSFGWRGRDLISATKGGLAYTFEYNADGLRTSKTVGGTVHKYYYSGSLLLAEEWGNNLMVFLYDANGAPIGMKYRTTSMNAGVWNTYWYERNLQGDVVAIYNESGVKVVSYVYDAWGNFTTTYHNGGASLTPVIKNPLLYRGYYYDRDLGMYYLQTRYYDSNIGRFLNADSYVSTGQGILGHNMYAYCNNNPVMYVDPTGEFTISFSIGFDITFFFIGMSFSIGFALDDKGNMAIQGSASAPAFLTTGEMSNFGLLDAGIGVSLQLTGDNTVYDLEGPSSYAGFTIGNGAYLGADLVYSGANMMKDFDTEKQLSGIQINIGLGIGVDMHFRQTQTFTIFPILDLRR